jgi:hypothetical protein
VQQTVGIWVTPEVRTEETMSTVGVDIAKGRASPWAIVIAGGAFASFIGLATAGSMLFTGLNAEARVPATHGPSVTSSAPAGVDTAPATLAIVPSPVIDPNPVFFFGTGDGSAGYYAERPLDERQQIGSARGYDSAL